MKYTEQELDNAAIADQLADAEFAEKQAADGPYYPERGITRESLLTYAAQCRAFVQSHKTGAHAAVLGK